MTANAASRPDPAASRRSLLLMLLLTALGAALVLLSVGRTWASGLVGGQLDVTATGSEITGAPSALALVGLASTVAVFAVRGAGRFAVGALVTAAGLGAAAAAGMGAVDTTALDAAAAKKLALVGSTASHISHTAWPWFALLGGLLLAAGGLLTLVRGRSWPTMGARYEAPAGGAAPAPRKKPAGAVRETPAELWKALDRGEDPTA
jgi:uncharacterized membrane protein (TIGR02234 family)